MNIVLWAAIAVIWIALGTFSRILVAWQTGRTPTKAETFIAYTLGPFAVILAFIAILAAIAVSSFREAQDE